MWQIWLIIAGLCIIIEIITVGFLAFWFAIGALITMVFSIFVDSIIIQFALFLICSTILLFATKPFVSRFQKSTPNYKTNSVSIEGETGIVTSEINTTQGTGQVKIKTETWSAISSTEDIIPEGTNVIVEKIEGVKAVVKKI